MVENPWESFRSKPKNLQNSTGFSCTGQKPPGSIPGPANQAPLIYSGRNALQVPALAG